MSASLPWRDSRGHGADRGCCLKAGRVLREVGGTTALPAEGSAISSSPVSMAIDSTDAFQRGCLARSA